MNSIEFLRERYKERWGINAFPSEMFLDPIVKSEKSLNILEIGCSEGYNLEFLNRNGFSNLHGIDMDESAIKKAKEHYNYINFDFCDITKTSSLIDIFNKKFDIIFSKSCLQHIIPEEINSVIQKIHDSLNESGMLFLYETGFEDETWRNRGLSEHTGITLGSGVYSHKYSELLKKYFFGSVEKISQEIFVSKK